MARIIITMPDALLRSVDDQARRVHESRSAVVRSALSEWVAAKERAEFEELLAAGYKEMASALEESASEYAVAQGAAVQAVWRWDE